jgi:phosphoketolase
LAILCKRTWACRRYRLQPHAKWREECNELPWRAKVWSVNLEPDVVMPGCGDLPTMESEATTALSRQHLPDVGS